ncbi:NME8 family protein [Megaselia abdita]
MFGTNVPNLMSIIARELTLLNKEHVTYEITELQPEEVARLEVIQAAQAEAARIEREEEENKRMAYLMHVTDQIIENLPDVGVTIFGPQVNRDMFKKLMEPAETQKIQCKDRRVAMITPEEFETINFDCKNKLDIDVINQLDKKELLICFWKASEDDGRPLEDIFAAYALDLMTPTPFVDELGMVDPEKEYPPILVPLEIKVKPEVEMPAEKEEVEEARKSEHPPPPEAEDIELPLDDVMEEDEEEEEQEGAEEEQLEEAEAEVQPVEDEEEMDYTKIILIPPIWVPHDRRTHATLIYVLFRQQTVGFLAPDPPPEPAHLVLAFDAHKTRQITNIMNKNPEDILHYGYFTSDDPEEAKLIANSIPNYQNVTPKNVTDKIVLKVSKQTSHTLLTLVTYGPSYVSPNTVVGRKEALKFFPEGYTTGDPNEVVEEEHGKKKKGRRNNTRFHKLLLVSLQFRALADKPELYIGVTLIFFVLVNHK